MSCAVKLTTAFLESSKEPSAWIMARVTGPVTHFGSRAIVEGLRRPRWSLAQASEHAGLASHMGSAPPDWLQELRRDFVELRQEIRGLVHEYEDDEQESAPAIGTSATGSAQGD